MWIVVMLWGFIGTLVLIAWRGNKWFAQNTAAHSDVHEGEKFAFHEERAKTGKLVNLLLVFDIPRERYFRLRPESWFDRFGKGVQLTIEPEANESVFDRMFFLDSDDEALVNLLLQQRKLRSMLIVLMGRLARQKARLLSLEAENGKLTLYLRVFSVSQPGRLRTECAAYLGPLLDAIRGMPATQASAVRRTVGGADTPRRVALALFAVGCASLSWIAFASPDRFLDPWAFARFSAAVGAAVFVVLTWRALRSLGRASNRHRALLLWSFFASIGVFGCSFTTLRAANIHLDFSSNELVEVGDAALLSRHVRKQGVVYSITFRSTTTDRVEHMATDWFEVRKLRRMWNGSDSGPATLRTHPGLFGFAWMHIDPQLNSARD